jgi:serine/threonine protein kinase
MSLHRAPSENPVSVRRAAALPGAKRLSSLLLGALTLATVAAAREMLPQTAAWLLGATVLALGATAARLRFGAERSRRFGPYTLDEKIGEGGMGVVFRAHHELLLRPTAVKLLAAERAREEDLRRFEREVQLTSMLTHPNTISIYDFGRTPEGTFYYAMEYVDGCDLQTLVEREGPQDPARVAHLLAQLSSALSEAHAAGLVHRDVKPANVMLCDRGGARDVVKVLDFGLTKQIGGRDVTKTDEQRIVGTPLYLSPEAVAAPERVDARSDLYALGAVGYFLLTGVAPFAGDNVIDVCFQHLHSAPIPPSKRLGAPVPPALEALILACLEKSKERRPSSAAVVEARLAPLAAEWTRERGAACAAAEPWTACAA